VQVVPILVGMSRAPAKKQLRLRRADRCTVCERDLIAGEQAVWDAVSRTVTCLACELPDAAVLEAPPGASAERQYTQRHQRREQHARDKLGILGTALARAVDEPQTTTSWKQGARGERQTAARLDKHLKGYPVKLLHDRLMPGHGQANIDHLAVGPGGVTVIDTKTHKGEIRVERVGGLFTDRHEMLLIGGHDQTKLIDGLERQLHLVRTALGRVGADQIDLRGALCFPDPDGLPTFRQLTVRAIVIDGPKPIARLIRRAGPLDSEQVDRIWRQLAYAFPCTHDVADRRRQPSITARAPADRHANPSSGRAPRTTLGEMAAPVPMLSSSGRRWPARAGWVLQPKWDGFRLNPSLLRLLHRG
jgi:hypothetical protein